MMFFLCLLVVYLSEKGAWVVTMLHLPRVASFPAS
jgi:hypothetical protein